MKWHSYLCPIHFGQISETSRGCALWLNVAKQLVVRCIFSGVFSTYSSRAISLSVSLCHHLTKLPVFHLLHISTHITERGWGKYTTPPTGLPLNSHVRPWPCSKFTMLGLVCFCCLSIYSATLLNNYFIPSHLYSYLQHSSFSFLALILLLASPKTQKQSKEDLHTLLPFSQSPNLHLRPYTVSSLVGTSKSSMP